MITLKINMVIFQGHYSLILIVSCMKLKPKMFIEILLRIKEMFDFSNYSAKSKIYDHSNKSVCGKMKER